MNMQPMHTDEIREKTGKRIRTGVRVMSLIVLAGALAITALLIWRSPTSMDKSRELPAQIAVSAVTILAGAVCIFYYGMKVAPNVAYRHYLREISSGLSHEEEGVVIRFDKYPTFRSGLDFYQLVINVGDLKEEKDERYFYWDASLPRPSLPEGTRVRAMVHGNELIWLTALEN